MSDHKKVTTLTKSEVAAVLLSNKGRTSSISEEDGVPRIVTREDRSISNLEEDAVNGLLQDLMCPIDVRQPRPAPPAEEEKKKIEVQRGQSDSSDEGVSDSSTSEPDDDVPFFDDDMGSPKLLPKKQEDKKEKKKEEEEEEEPAKLERKKSEPPAVLKPQVSQVSWLDYLRDGCPICEEMNQGGAEAPGTTACGPCGAKICKSCVMIFKQAGEEKYVRVCRKCRKLVPEDGELICGVCCKEPISSESSVKCTECSRDTCNDCCQQYFLKTLGETEPRLICSACVAQVQKNLSALKQSSPRKEAPALRARGGSSSFIKSPRKLEREKSTEKNTSGKWRPLKSPRAARVSMDKSPRQARSSVDRKPLRRSASSASKSKINSGKFDEAAPFPGVKLHMSSGNMNAEVPQTLVRRGSRPTERPKAMQVKFKEEAEKISIPSSADREPASIEEKGIVIFDYCKETDGELELKRGGEVEILSRDGEWAEGRVVGSSTTGIFPLENVSFDESFIAAARALRQQEQEKEPVYLCGMFVRTMVGGEMVECEVLREGNSHFPYRLRAEVSQEIIQVKQEDIRPSMRSTVASPDAGSAVSKKERFSETYDDTTYQQTEPELDAHVLGSLKAKVLELQEQRLQEQKEQQATETVVVEAELGEEIVAAELGEEISSADLVATTNATKEEEEAVVESDFSRDKKLFAAVRKNEIGMVLQALDNGANPNACHNGVYPLLVAAKMGERFRIMKLLLERGASPDSQTSSGWCSLHFAVSKHESIEMVELLRSHGARVDIINEWMKSPLDIAKDKELLHIVEALTKKTLVSKRMSRSSTRAIEIVKKDNDTASDDSVKKVNNEQEEAARQQELEAAREKKLLEEAKARELEEARLRLEKVAREKEENDRRRLEEEMQARKEEEEREREEEAKRLKRLEFETKQANMSAMDALEDLEKIISEPERTTVAREPPAIEEPVAEASVAHHHIEPPKDVDGSGFLITPQPEAPKPEPVAVPTTTQRPFNNAPTKSVIMARPKAKQRNPNRRGGGSDLSSSLVDACKEGDLTRMKSLVSQGAPVNKRCPKTGNTPLIASVLSGSNIAIMYILDHPDVDLNVPNKAGDTVLHVLAATNNDDAAVWLIQRGADVNFKNALGKTPLDISTSLQQAVARAI